MSEVEQMLRDAIAKRDFNWMEMKGFQICPQNALLAGAAIGYGLGIEEGRKRLEEIVNQCSSVSISG